MWWALGGFPAFAVDLEVDVGADFEGALGDLDLVDRQAALLLCVQDSGLALIPPHSADIAHLPTGLGVEGSAVEHRDTLAGHLFDGFRLLSVGHHQAEEPCAGFQIAVAHELAPSRTLGRYRVRAARRLQSGWRQLWVDLRRQFEVEPRQFEVEPRQFDPRPRPLPLLRQRRLEPRLVDPELLLLGDLPHRLDRQAESVVELERHVAGKHRRALAPSLLDRLLDLAGADRERLQELCLLGRHGGRRRLAGLLQFRVLVTEHLSE